MSSDLIYNNYIENMGMHHQIMQINRERLHFKLETVSSEIVI